MTPRLSVSIPTYQAGRFLRRTLSALCAQSEPSLEILVCDDHSSDATLDIARSQDDARVRVIENGERLGLAANWNRAVAEATGEFVCLFGQDDTADAEWAGTLCDRLAAHPSAGMVFGRRRFVFDDDQSRATLGEFFEQRYPAMLAPFYATLDRLADDLVPAELMLEAAMQHRFEINLIGEPSFVVFRRTHSAAIGGFDTTMRQLIDWEFWTRFFAVGPIVTVREVLGSYHLHADGASTENAPLAKHYRELDYLLGVVLPRFAAHLDAGQTAALIGRRAEARQLAIEHERRDD